MSLDVILTMPRDEPTRADKAIKLLRKHGFDDFADEIEWKHEHGDIEVYSSNITHNLSKMANEAGIYEILWRPDEIDITKAEQIIAPLRAGIKLLIDDPVYYRQFNATNGWGLYEHFLPWCQNYLVACVKNPKANVSVCR